MLPTGYQIERTASISISRDRRGRPIGEPLERRVADNWSGREHVNRSILVACLASRLRQVALPLRRHPWNIANHRADAVTSDVTVAPAAKTEIAATVWRSR